MCFKYIITVSGLLLLVIALGAEKKRIFSVEHPVISYFNRKFFSHANITSVRYRRNNPIYYLNAHISTLQTADNNITVIFYLYELSKYNGYFRNFIDFQFKFCDMVNKEDFFGAPLRDIIGSCPYPPGDFHILNMTLPHSRIPEMFPLNKGRGCVNATLANKVLLMNSCADYEIRDVFV